MVWIPGLAESTATLQEQVDAYAAQGHNSQAVAALLITPEGTETALAGQTGNPRHPGPTPDTLFEIGSVTKVFTALLLAEQIEQGVLTLDTPVATRLPSDDPTALTLQPLASHTAGLPRLPIARVLWATLYPANPYRGSQPEELYGAIATASPDPATCEYSNLGPALLGQLLATAGGQPYETLVQTQVLTPLGLTDTHFDLDAAARDRLAQGYKENTLPTANWQLDAYAPAGGLKSTLTDMGQFLVAAMAADWPPLALSLQPQSEDCEPNFGLGWVFTDVDGAPMIMHNGRTGGYYAFVGWLPEAEQGLVLLTNTSDAQGDEVAKALLTGSPLPTCRPGASSIILALVLAGLLGYQSWTLWRSPSPTSWMDAIEEALETSLYLALAYQLGPWQWLPLALWWVLLVLLVGLSLRRQWLRRGWKTGLSRSPSDSAAPVTPWRYLRLMPNLLLLGWTILYLR